MLQDVIMREKQGYLITDRCDRRYFSGVDVSEGFLLLSHYPAYFTDARYYSMTVKKLKGSNITPVLYQGLTTIKEYIKSHGIKKLYVDFRNTTLKEFESYKSLKVKLLDCSEIFEKARADKSDEEILSISKACEITQKAYYLTLEKVKKGITEKALAEIMKKNMLKLGAEEESFETIVAFGKNSAVPHHETGEDKLTDNSVILIDTGCKVNGYCSDLTRTCFFGKPTEKFIRCYNSVLKANTLANENITVGMKLKEADKIARDALKEEGLDEYFTHSLGHGVGLNVHEYPTVSPKGRGELYERCVFTIEPGVYIDGEFGIRIEDTVVIKDGKAKRLFTDDKKLLLI